MLASVDTLATVFLAVVAIAFLVGVGACVGILAGRQAANKSNGQLTAGQRRAPERVTRELGHCVELGACVTRDADALSATLAQSSGVPRELATSVQQLIKTTKGLAGRLQRIEEETPPGTEVTAVKPSEPLATADKRDTQTNSNPPNVPAAQDSSATEPSPETTDEPENQGEEARRFPRSPCHGNLKATIYPPPSSPGGDPVHCTVLTRDLSCGGIGIAHTEQLYPRQIIVLNAVGKLLVGEVRWCRRLDDRFYIAGCRLVKTGD
jgi:hypothetical protein